MSRRRKIGLIVVLHLVALGALALWRGCGDDRRAEPPRDVAEIEQIDVVSRELAEIPPGTEITDRPPEGFSHLIIKSWPRVGPETIGEISESTAAIVSLLFTAVVADVQEKRAGDGKASFYLAKVAIGVGADVGGRDVTLTPETQAELGADLGWMDRRVLSGGRDKFREMRCLARSRTMALLDGPEVLLRDGEHCRVIFRYAVLVDAETGRLDTLLWALDLDDQGGVSNLIGPIQLLPPSKVEDCVLHADPDKFLFGVPTAIAFAMTSIPQGEQTIACPEPLKPLLSQLRLTPDAARRLQRRLRELIRRAE